MKSIAIGEFKARCLSVLEQVRRKKERLVITRRGQPIAEVGPLKNPSTKTENPLLNSIIHEKDIVAPLEVEWTSLK